MNVDITDVHFLPHSYAKSLTSLEYSELSVLTNRILVVLMFD